MMVSRLGAVILCAATLFSIPDPAAAESWNKLQSEHFLIVGEVTQGRLSAIAKTLEDYRRAAERVFGDLDVQASSPLTIVVISPVSMIGYGGGGIAGYYAATPGHDYIVMSSETFGGSDFEVVLHEYQHLITHANFPVAPRWVHEGLAEFYSTFEQTDGGRRYKIGLPLSRHLATLNSDGVYPLMQFLQDDGRSMRMDERFRVGIYYAQSWALVHFFMLGDEGRWSKNFGPFIDAIVAGEDVEAAFRRTVSTDVAEFENRFRAYLKARRFSFMWFNAPPAEANASAVGTGKLSEAETETLKATLLNDPKKKSQALALALNAGPSYRPALVLKATELLRDGQTGRAADELAALAQSDPSDVDTCSLATLASNLAGRYDRSIAICPEMRGSVALAFDRAVALESLGAATDALRLYDAIKRAPPEALRDIDSRAWRYLEKGRYQAAARASDLVMARVVRDANAMAYTRFVRTVSRCLLGVGCSEARAELKAAPVGDGASEWVRQLFQFLTGDGDDGALLKRAGSKEELTEAHTYIALDLLARKKPSEAIPHLKWVAERGSQNVSEYRVAVSHLSQIEKSDAQ